MVTVCGPSVAIENTRTFSVVISSDRSAVRRVRIKSRDDIGDT
jgi:hypothetical protein